MFKKGDRVSLVSIAGSDHYQGTIDSISGNWVVIKDEENGFITAVNAAVIVLIKAESKVTVDSDVEELDTDIENEKPSNPMIDKALSLAEARNEKLRLEKEGIKDTLTDEELKPTEHHYAMPSFKKHTKD